ncbi:MAG TPA: Ada metal-binding domain-containing protein [Mucilaginibacter sp.]|jgi:methylphosphotriester-DNA--protein-cysteine methyltransferase|nr:Ada metal-binding domain-containing protein [Mucilaginibacter sp.]
MIRHTELGVRPFERSRRLKLLLAAGSIIFAGNLKLKIYGKLNCVSGKRMRVENRVFFASEAEAVTQGFRPCGHCLKEAYRNWRALRNS